MEDIDLEKLSDKEIYRLICKLNKIIEERTQEKEREIRLLFIEWYNEINSFHCEIYFEDKLGNRFTLEDLREMDLIIN